MLKILIKGLTSKIRSSLYQDKKNNLKEVALPCEKDAFFIFDEEERENILRKYAPHEFPKFKKSEIYDDFSR
jgi:hypothetical protein